ncbi:uroporphyrinogen-III synthase [Motiliproteus sp. SC1-56]|uniref:uroporphyrinogen-III synthase n=1 Tax=Motiliproteus sp. SC1-56 TaxID=2799565 RepID=UPI001A902CB5|nr:uroporphyrinogen-III synthase [Motiliproteus sp. SC1-56]
MSHAPLTGERVLVTRPAHQADALCQHLQALGAEAVRFPTLAIHPCTPDNPQYSSLKQKFLDLDHYHAVIFVSANAARLGHEWIDSYWPQLPLRIHWLAVGQATARTLSELGIPAQHPDQAMDSEALLALPILQELDHQRVLICRGEGGRELLAQTLQARGAQVDYAELYRRGCPTYSSADIESIIYKSPPTVMLVTSGEALDNLVRLCRQVNQQFEASALRRRLLVVPSPRVAEQAHQLGFEQVREAANATDGAMLEALQRRD